MSWLSNLFLTQAQRSEQAICAHSRQEADLYKSLTAQASAEVKALHESYETTMLSLTAQSNELVKGADERSQENQALIASRLQRFETDHFAALTHWMNKRAEYAQLEIKHLKIIADIVAL